MLQLDHPLYALLLAVLPLVVLVGWRSLAGLGPVRRWAAIGLRLAVLTAWLGALTEPGCRQARDERVVVFVVDRSGSIPPKQRESSAEYVRQAVEHRRDGRDRFGVVAFDQQAVIELTPTLDSELPDWNRTGGAPGTHLAAALRLAGALLPDDVDRRIVLLSDGNETIGDAAGEVNQLAARGVPVDVIELPFAHPTEVVFERLQTPARARLDEPFELGFMLRSTGAASGRLWLYQDDQPVDLDPQRPELSLSVNLAPGPNRFAFTHELATEGVHEFRAVFEPASNTVDALPTNNQARGVIVTGGKDHVLLLCDGATPIDRAACDLLAQALDHEKISYVRHDIAEFRPNATELLGYSAVVLNNISAFSLTDAGGQALSVFVREMGGGLVVIGGDQAFSVGGYARSPIDEVLPVTTSMQRRRILQLALVLVIDRSGSMQGMKIATARDAALATTEILDPRDEVGIIAFDSDAEWVHPLNERGDGNAVRRSLMSIGAGGGTNLEPALQMAAQAVGASAAALRHVIVVTDGRSTPGNFEAWVNKIRSEQATLSTVSIGADADSTLLAHLAELGGGRHYLTHNSATLPQIFIRETVLAARSGIYEREFQPRPTGGMVDHSLMAGMGALGWPRLLGHVVTEAKDAAQVLLVREHEDGADPILASWQVGLGRVVAFTSGLWPSWGPDWSAWPGFAKLWGQAVRWAASPTADDDVRLQTLLQDGVMHVTLEGVRQEMSNLSASVSIIAPDLSSQPLELRRTGPNRLEGEFHASQDGTYLVRAGYEVTTTTGPRSGLVRAGAGVAYSDEYRDLRSNPAALQAIAQATGGRVLPLSDPASTFDPRLVRNSHALSPLWRLLVLLGAGLFLLDVAVRRLSISPREIWRRITRREKRTEQAGAPVMDRLKRARQAAGSSRLGPESDTLPSREPEQTAAGLQTVETLLTDLPKSPRPRSGSDALGKYSAPPAPRSTTPAQDAEGVTASQRLLDLKRRLRAKQDSDADDSHAR